MGGERLQLTIAPKSYSWTFRILINIFVALFNIYDVLRQLDLTYKYSPCACFNLLSVIPKCFQSLSARVVFFRLHFFVVLLLLPIRLLFQLHHHFISFSYYSFAPSSCHFCSSFCWRCCFYSYKYYCRRNLSLWQFLFFLLSIINS